MHQHKNNRRGSTALAKRAMLGAMVATAFAASTAAPASATVAAGADAPETGENITVFHNLDFIAYFAAPAAEDVVHRVEVIREGVVVGRATGPARDGGEGPALEVNHGGASGPGDCWEGVTPDVKPGDRIKVTNLETNDVDEVTVDNIVFSGNPYEVTDPAVAPVGSVAVDGIAQRADGSPIGAAFLDSSEFRDDGGQYRPTGRFVDSATVPGGFTLIYESPFAGRGAPASVAQRKDILLTQRGHSAGFGHVEVLPLESMLVDGLDDEPGPAAAGGCEAAPAAGPNSALISQSTINLLNNGLGLGGTFAAPVTGVNVTLTDSDATNAPLAPIAATLGTSTWSVTLTPEQVAALADGTITATVDFVGGATPARTFTVQKDTAAGQAGADLAPGSYVGARSVGLTAGPGETIEYAVDGGAFKAYTGVKIPLPVGTTSIVVRVTDAAGNVTTSLPMVYTITAPPAQQQQQTQQQAPASPVQQLAKPQAAPSRVLPVATLLSSQKRTTASAAKRKGLVSRFTAPAGAKTAVIRVFRSKGGKLTRVGSKTATVKQGSNSVKLNGKALRRKLTAGLYAVQVTLRASDGAAGAPQASMVRITK